MKNIIKKTKVVLSIMLILSLMPFTVVNASLVPPQPNGGGDISANITLQSRKSTVSYGDEIEVLVEASNIQAGQGLTKFEANLDVSDLFVPVADKTLGGMSGWKVTYESNTRTITATPDIGTAAITANGPIFQIPLKVKTESQFNTQPGDTNSPAPTPAPNLLGVPDTANQTEAPVTEAPLDGQAQIPNRGTVTLKNIKITGGVGQSKNLPDVSTEVSVSNGIGVTDLPTSEAPTELPTEPITDTPIATAAETPSEIIHAGLNDAPVMILLALGVVAVISFLGYRKFSGNN